MSAAAQLTAAVDARLADARDVLETHLGLAPGELRRVDTNAATRKATNPAHAYLRRELQPVGSVAQGRHCQEETWLLVVELRVPLPDDDARAAARDVLLAAADALDATTILRNDNERDALELDNHGIVRGPEPSEDEKHWRLEIHVRVSIYSRQP